MIARHYAEKRERKQTQTELFNLSPDKQGLRNVILLTPLHMLGKPATFHFVRQRLSKSDVREPDKYEAAGAADAARELTER